MQDPVPDNYAAAAELRRVAEDAHAGMTGELLLAAMTVAWAKVGDLTGERLEWAGRALLLLGDGDRAETVMTVPGAVCGGLGRADGKEPAMTTSLSPTPAERAAPRRRRSALAVVAALLLLLPASLVLIGEADEGLSVGTGLFCLVLGVAAAGLVWGGRAGYWFGLVVTAILALIITLTIGDDGLDGGDIILAAIVVAPFVLLLPPAARSPFREDAARRPPPESGRVLPDADEGVASAGRGEGTDGAPAGGTASGDTWPEGWTRPLAHGWVTFAFMLLGGAALTVFGLVVLVSGERSDPWLAGAAMLFGLGCVTGASLFRPPGRRGRTRLRLETIDLGDRPEHGIAFPYSRLRTAAAFFVGAALALSMVVFTVGEGVKPGGSSWPPWLGVAGGLMLLGVVYLGVRKGLGRHWRVVLTPSAVVFAQGRDLTVVPWEAIDEIRAFEVTTYARGFAIREPFIGLVAGDREAIRTGRFERAMMGVNRALGADISLPIRSLATDPVLLYATLRRYHRDPGARAGLGTEAALQSFPFERQA